MPQIPSFILPLNEGEGWRGARRLDPSIPKRTESIPPPVRRGRSGRVAAGEGGAASRVPVPPTPSFILPLVEGEEIGRWR